MKLWVGPEMEGRYMGWQTLFIASPIITEERIYEVLKDKPEIKQLYFGAGGCTNINTSVMRKFLRANNKNDLLITAEVDIDKLDDYSYGIFQEVNLIVTINHPNLGLLGYTTKGKTQIKLQTLNRTKKKILAVGRFKDFDETNLDLLEGLKYKDDEVIE